MYFTFTPSVNYFYFFLPRYEEVCKPGYDFSTGKFDFGTGHFTQVVWKGSTELGIGKAVGKKNGMFCTYIVGRYRGPGNYQGRFQNNVAKGSFTKSICDKLDDIIKDLSQNGREKAESQGGGVQSAFGTGGFGDRNTGGNVGGNNSQPSSGGGTGKFLFKRYCFERPQD